ncbi:MAG: alkylhydroperoxidase [Ignavibacteria bacterium CG2_30_36_16]|nr:alkylhydroperoxidase [Ignavibacteria bacterium]OIP56061.1 MAG: alkylhydroperoxidase [Ignavibacteria bacterium CG2_30_36_16]PJB00916.1 MAG: alkylhydroperoxidase [Ignavibacteria bacterium CG_4_9_14_3_um_filter_36_18]
MTELLETKNDLLKDLGIAGETIFNSLDKMVDGETKYVKDLRINLKNTINSGHLSFKETYLIAGAVAVNEKVKLLANAFLNKAEENGATPAEVAETIACASLLATNNVFYRYKHFIKSSNEKYQNMPAKIKMNIMMNPVLGKEFFELMSLAVSAVNGCESCVNNHEESVRKLGSGEERIFDAIRLASVIKGLTVALG